MAQCRFCHAKLSVTFADLGMSPIANAYLPPEKTQAMEPFYPLHAFVCENCFLVQLESFESPESIFSEYAYFSSYSDSWLKHASDYADEMTSQHGIGPTAKIVELASNDGYLLQYFKKKGMNVLGVEPAANVAKVAIEKGIPSEVSFFGRETALRLKSEGKAADLLLGNNVLAHVPDLNDFVAGMKILLAPQGTITMEFPHLLRLIQHNQFDTIYHEHFSYFSFMTAEKIFRHHGITLYRVDELSTHGGSIRIFGAHSNENRPLHDSVAQIHAAEKKFRLDQLETYRHVGERVKKTKRSLLQFLINAKNDGKTVVGYGAPAKGNTLLNYCGVKTDMIDYTVDRSTYKQGRFLPGTHIPIFSPEKIRDTRPDYVLILPWNLKTEITQQMSWIKEWGGKFVTPIPEVEVLS
ncbi:class I SAM-dependent methyltransferase [Bdellovibrionota bacterium FG-1]